jgi:hypothetical protein
MNIKNFTVFDNNCSPSHPCKHYGIIETLDGLKYEGLICSSISNAIISKISLKCLQILPEQTQTAQTQTPESRKLKFLSHIYLYQTHKDKPLAEVLKQLPFILNIKESTVLNGAVLDEFIIAIAKVKNCSKDLAESNTCFEEAPDLYDKLKGMVAKLIHFVERYPINEDEIRTLAPHLSEAELLLYSFSNQYLDISYKMHIKKLFDLSCGIKALLGQPLLFESEAVKLQKLMDQLMTIYKQSPKTQPKIPVTPSETLKLELSKAEQEAYNIWQLGNQRIESIVSNKSNIDIGDLRNARRQAEKQPEKTQEKSEKQTEKTQEKQSDKVTIPEEFFCPITNEIMTDPVITPQGTSFEKSAIVDWLSRNSTCPMTREPLQANQLIPNRSLKDLIEKWQTQTSINQTTASSTSSSTLTSASTSQTPEERLNMEIEILKKLIASIEIKIFNNLEVSQTDIKELKSCIQNCEKCAAATPMTMDIWKNTYGPIGHAEGLVHALERKS